MSKRGRKGRVSNDLVAASCAAVLTVYAAGYWRTRDAARRLETQAQEHRPVRPTAPAALPVAPAPETAAPTPPAEPPVAVTAESPAPEPAKKTAAKVAAAPAPPVPEPAVAAVPVAVAAVPAILSVPLDPEPKEWPPPPLTADSLPPPTGVWRDGTYTGWGQSNHGDIEAKAVIENGRIVASGINYCATRYPCDVIHTIIHQPVWTQSPEVDRVSRATESADAYYYGLVEALKKASEAPADTATTPK
ncbi:MAG: hypothetical protein ABI859_14230 [Pseudomonadota bacterium]